MLIFDNQIVIVLSRSFDKPILEDELSYMDSFLIENNLRVGMSDRFDTFKEVRQYYLQAVKCLEIGWKLKRPELIYRYEALTVHFLLELCSKYKPIEQFIHPAVTELIEYDRIHGTDYVNTLGVYVYYLQNQLKASKALKLNRGTLINRVNKITELLNLNLDNANTLFHLRLSYKILQYKIHNQNQGWHDCQP